MLIKKCVCIIVAASWLIGCSHDADVVGNWSISGTVPGKLVGEISMVPDYYRTHPQPKFVGPPIKAEIRFVIRSDHTFWINMFGVSGTWSRKGNEIILIPSEDSKALRSMNGYSRTSTHGIPDIYLEYSPTLRTMTWVWGQPRQDARAEIVMKKI